MFARPNSVIATGARADRPDYDFADGVTVNLFEIAEDARIVTTVPTITGELAATFTTTSEGNAVVVRKDGAPAEWAVVYQGRRVAMAADETECRLAV